MTEGRGMKDKYMVWNGNELVWRHEPDRGIAGLAPITDDAVGKEIAHRWNSHEELKYLLSEWEKNNE